MKIICKLLVIGAGPGGYVCAIRAGQLGIDTVIDGNGKARRHLPQYQLHSLKAIIHAADEFDAARRMAEAVGSIGIRAEGVTIDLARTIAWKDGIVGRLTGGVAALLQRARVKQVHGRARFSRRKDSRVETETGACSHPRGEHRDRDRLEPVQATGIHLVEG